MTDDERVLLVEVAKAVTRLLYASHIPFPNDECREVAQRIADLTEPVEATNKRLGIG